MVGVALASHILTVSARCKNQPGVFVEGPESVLMAHSIHRAQHLLLKRQRPGGGGGVGNVQFSGDNGATLPHAIDKPKFVRMKMKGSFGLVVLVIAMAVVLLLVAQAWQRLALPAAEFARPGSTQGVAAHGQSDAVNAVHTDGTRLNKTQQKTDAHTDAVNEAIASID